LLSLAAVAFGDPGCIPLGFGFQSCRAVAITPVHEMRSDLAFEANAEDFGADLHAFASRSPILRNLRPRAPSLYYFFLLLFLGGVRDMSRDNQDMSRDRCGTCRRALALSVFRSPCALAVALVGR
jgi:hypothetical protein